MHIAGADKFSTPQARDKLLNAAKKNHIITSYVYDTMNHAFARPNGQDYNAEAAELANKRTVDFFAEHLQT